MITPKSEKKIKPIKLMIPLRTELNGSFQNEIKSIKKNKNDLNKTQSFFRRKINKPLDLSRTKKLSKKGHQRPYNQKISKYNILKTNSNSNLYIDNYSNIKTQGNTFISGVNMNYLPQNASSDNIVDKICSKNSINFKDRQKLKATKILGLKLYEQFEVEKRKLSVSNTSKNNYKYNDDNNNNDIIRINNISERSNYDYKDKSLLGDYFYSEINKKKKNKKNVQYSLKQLMKLNPYIIMYPQE